ASSRTSSPAPARTCSSERSPRPRPASASSATSPARWADHAAPLPGRRAPPRRPGGHLSRREEPMSAVGELASIVSSRKKGGPKEKHPDNKVGLAFMTPWLLGFLGITLIPMIASFGLAFTDYSLLAAPD